MRKINEYAIKVKFIAPSNELIPDKCRAKIIGIDEHYYKHKC